MLISVIIQGSLKELAKMIPEGFKAQILERF